MKKQKLILFSFMSCISFGTLLQAQVYEITRGNYTYPGGVSDNSTVAMYEGNNVLIWDASNGISIIGSVTNGEGLAGTPVISSDGTKVSATTTNPASNLNEISIYDINSKTWTYLGGLNTTGTGKSLSSAWGMTHDGSTIVGLADFSNTLSHAVKWDAVSGMVDLGSMVEGRYSRANAISNNKTTVVGYQDNEVGSRFGTRWVNGVQEYLFDQTGENIGEASGVSADGKTIVGANGFYPYIWNETTGYKEITHPNSGVFFRGGATAVSEDGKTVIGYFRQPPPSPPMRGEGFIWTAEKGRVNLNEYVASLGIDTKGFTFGLPLAISRDGKKIAGIGDSGGSGPVTFLIDLTEALANQEMIKQNSISIVPNPVQDILTIRGITKLENVAIFDLAGNKILESKKMSIDTSNLSKGTYIISITTKDKKINTKFIKK